MAKKAIGHSNMQMSQERWDQRANLSHCFTKWDCPACNRSQAQMLPQNPWETADSASVWLGIGYFPMPVELGMYGHPFTESDHYLIFLSFYSLFFPSCITCILPWSSFLNLSSPFPFLLIAPKDSEEKKCQNDCPHNRTACSVPRLFLESLAIAERKIEVDDMSIFLNGREMCVCMFRDFFFFFEKKHLACIYLFLQWK